jgi:thymidine kinase
MTIEVETGPMFSGKTSELLAQAEKLILAGEIQGEDFLAFNHSSDNRYGKGIISSHGKACLEAISVGSSQDIFTTLFTIDKHGQIELRHNRYGISTIFVDEGQFFDENLGMVLEFIDRFYLEYVNRSIKIYCAGLDMDFRGEPFGPMPDVMSRAHKVNKFTAVCKECDRGTPHDAQYTQRIVNGHPANYDEPIVLVGASESYTARCQKHHEVPGKPQPKF